MKNVVKRIILSVVVVIMMTCFCACAEESVDLIVSVEDVCVKVGEMAELKYSTNQKDAVLTFEIENKSIAVIETENSKFYIVGKAVGETTIILRARYGKYENKASAKIVVENENAAENAKFEFDNFNNISLEGNVFTMTNKFGWFSVLPVENFNITSIAITCENETLSIEAEKNADSTMFIFSSQTSGEYAIEVCVNGKTYNYVFSVEL